LFCLYYTSGFENLYSVMTVLKTVLYGMCGMFKQLLVSAVTQPLLSVFLGKITTRTSLDRRLQDQHMVRVSAVDGGGHAGYAVVRVYVTAEPSAMPMFLMTEYRANVFADVAPATSVLKVGCRYFVESLDMIAYFVRSWYCCFNSSATLHNFVNELS